MRINLNIMSLCLTAVTIFTACQNEVPDNPKRSSALQINVSTQPRYDSNGRAMMGPVWPDGASIGVSVVDAGTLGDYELMPYMNQKWTYTETTGEWAENGQAELRLYEREAAAIAYYPYADNATSFTAIPVTAGATDYLCSGVVKGLDVENPVANFTMKHIMTAFRFIIKTVNYSGAKQFERLQILSQGLASSASYNAVQDRFNNCTVPSDFIDIPMTPTTITDEGVAVEWLAIPTGQSDELTVIFTVDSQEYISTIKVDGGITSGKQITCTLILDPTNQ